MGLTLRNVLLGHDKTIGKMSWSPDGQLIAAPSQNGTIRVWDITSEKPLYTLQEHSSTVYAVAWSPDGSLLASASADRTVKLWDAGSGKPVWSFERKAHVDAVFGVSWTPDSKYIATGGKDCSIRVWDVRRGEQVWIYQGFSEIRSLAWSPRGGLLAVGTKSAVQLWNVDRQDLQGNAPLQATNQLVWSGDGRLLLAGLSDSTARVINGQDGRLIGTMEGHTDQINSIGISASGRLIATKSADGTIRIWRADTLDIVGQFVEQGVNTSWMPGLAFHPTNPRVLATLDNKDRSVRVWDLNEEEMLASGENLSTLHYCNAKIALLGESGVGKSALATVLSGKDFAPTVSTSGRRIWTLSKQQVQRTDGRSEIREILMWDMAGQSDYRLIHQLHMDEIDIALMIVDAKEPNPLRSIEDWNRALVSASRVRNKTVTKYLVFSRTDRGEPKLSPKDMIYIRDQLGINKVFRTSSFEGWGIQELREEIHRVIDWDSLPSVSSTDLFQSIKAFLLDQKKRGILLGKIEDLGTEFFSSRFNFNGYSKTEDSSPFQTCIRLLESQGLLRRFSFGDLVLLQPEMIDVYASSIVNSTIDGVIPESDVKTGQFSMPARDRADETVEQFLLIATIQDLIDHEIALREDSIADPLLIFPTRFTREAPDVTAILGTPSVQFSFQGAIPNIYATLAVRLANSGMFVQKSMWRNVIEYTSQFGDLCALTLTEQSISEATISLVYGNKVTQATRSTFEYFVFKHLEDRAVANSVNRQLIFSCPNCQSMMPEEMVQKRLKMGKDSITCPVCEQQTIPLFEPARSSLDNNSNLLRMKVYIDRQKQMQKARYDLEGKRALGEYDLLLFYDSKEPDNRNVAAVAANYLKGQGILPMIGDEQSLPNIIRDYQHIKNLVICYGRHGAHLQSPRTHELLKRFVQDSKPVYVLVLPQFNGDKLRLPSTLREAQIVSMKPKSTTGLLNLSNYIQRKFEDTEPGPTSV
jgi:WD40 repeat protein